MATTKHNGFVQMADGRSVAGDESGAQYYSAHVTAVGEAMQQN
jgi:hypothetical protein